MQQTTPSAEEIRKEFDQRALDVAKARVAEREERRNARDAAFDEMGDASCRANEPPGKEGIDVYVAEKLSTHHFFTKLSPDIVEKRLEDYLRAEDIEITTNADKYELDFSLGKQAAAKTVDETLL